MDAKDASILHSDASLYRYCLLVFISVPCINPINRSLHSFLLHLFLHKKPKQIQTMLREDNGFERKRGRENKLEYPSHYTYQVQKKYVYLGLNFSLIMGFPVILISLCLKNCQFKPYIIDVMEEVRVFSKHWVTNNQKNNKIKMKHNFPRKKPVLTNKKIDYLTVLTITCCSFRNLLNVTLQYIYQYFMGRSMNAMPPKGLANLSCCQWKCSMNIVIFIIHSK